jgi:hypothetical protein
MDDSSLIKLMKTITIMLSSPILGKIKCVDWGAAEIPKRMDREAIYFHNTLSESLSNIFKHVFIADREAC